MRLRWLLALLALAQLMDWATTEWFIRLGVPEANPLFRPLVWPALGAGVLAVKLVSLLAVTGAVAFTAGILPRITRGVILMLACASWGVVGYSAYIIITVSLRA